MSVKLGFLLEIFASIWMCVKRGNNVLPVNKAILMGRQNNFVL